MPLHQYSAGEDIRTSLEVVDRVDGMQGQRIQAKDRKSRGTEINAADPWDRVLSGNLACLVIPSAPIRLD